VNPHLSFLDGRVLYFGRFLPLHEANSLYRHLRETVPWQQERIRMMGKWVLQPRLTAWYGDPDACYSYSGLLNRPLPWIPVLEELRNRIEAGFSSSFNSVLLNCYRDGRDYMGWHADDERSLGPDPVIASLSLGAERRFFLRLKTSVREKHSNTPYSKDQTELLLGSGSLLLMRGGVQQDYKHALPKALRVNESRINLTFRRIMR